MTQVEQSLLRVGVVGTGFGGKIHVPVLQRMTGVRVVGVAGARPERTESVARSLGLDRVYESWEAVVDDDSLDAVTIAVPPARQHEVVLAAIRKGKHVLCEKPFGTSAAQAREMWHAARDAHVVHMVNYLFRMGPAHERLRSLVRAGAIGQLRRVDVEWTLAGRATRDPEWSWHFDPCAGGGALFAFGSHVIDYVEWLFGPVGAASAHLATRKPIGGGRGRCAEDTVDALLLLRDGTPVAVALSTVIPGGRGHWISAYGERGALVLGNGNLGDAVFGTRLYRTAEGGNALQPVEIGAADACPSRESDGRAVLFEKVAGRFAGAIRSGIETRPDFSDGWRAQRVMDAIRASARTRRWVDVPAADD